MTTALIHHGPRSKAGALARRMARRKPDAKALANRAAECAPAGEYARAESLYRRAIAVEPTASRWYGLAGAILGVEERPSRPDEFEAACREALALEPDFAEAANSLALALCARFESGGTHEAIDEAIGLSWKAYGLTESVECLANHAIALQLGGRLDRAGKVWDAIVDAGLATPRMRLMRSMLLLLTGDWLAGWPEYQQLFEPEAGDGGVYPADRPRWAGEPTDGTIMIVATHGHGDNFQFLRYADKVRQRCGRVVVAALANSGHHHAAEVFARYPGVDAVVTDCLDVPDHDYWVAPMMLPAIFGTEPPWSPFGFGESAIPPPPRLAPGPEVARWRPLVETIPGFRVGVCWRGDTKNSSDGRRSYDPTLLAPLAAVPGVSLMALQIGRDDEIRALPITPIPGRANWTDTAAVIRQLDLVIACDTGVAHLAGTLGVPTWIAVADPPEWRWLLGRDDSPWYPSVRLFRQRQPLGWPDVFARIEAALREALFRNPTTRLEVNHGRIDL